MKKNMGTSEKKSKAAGPAPSREAVARASHRTLTPSIPAPTIKPVRNRVIRVAKPPSPQEVSRQATALLFGKPKAPSSKRVSTNPRR